MNEFNTPSLTDSLTEESYQEQLGKFLKLSLADQVRALCLVALERIQVDLLIEWIEHAYSRSLTEEERRDVTNEFVVISSDFCWNCPDNITAIESMGLNHLLLHHFVVDTALSKVNW